jgi:hypothetical protein
VTRLRLIRIDFLFFLFASGHPIVRCNIKHLCAFVVLIGRDGGRTMRTKPLLLTEVDERYKRANISVVLCLKLESRHR